MAGGETEDAVHEKLSAYFARKLDQNMHISTKSTCCVYVSGTGMATIDI